MDIGRHNGDLTTCEHEVPALVHLALGEEDAADGVERALREGLGQT